MVPRVISRRQQPTYGKLPKRFPSVNFGSYTQRGLTRHQNVPSAPAAPSPFTPVAGNAGAIGSTASSESAPDPRDAQYFNDIAKLNQFHNQRAVDIQTALNEGQQSLTKSNTLLAEQQPKDTLAAKENANKAGLLYAGALGKNIGDIETSYARRRSDLQGAYEKNRAGLLRQYSENDVNFGLNQNDILLNSIGRQSERDQTFGVPDSSPPQSVAPAAVGTAPIGSAASRYIAARKRNPRGVWGRY